MDTVHDTARRRLEAELNETPRAWHVNNGW